MGMGLVLLQGRAREITREEAYEIIRKAEEEGLLHQMPNVEGEGETAAICNCCSCGCFATRLAGLYEAYDGCSSNYRAQVDHDKCVACGLCVEYCPTNALKLGQKLCTKTPLPEPVEKAKILDHVWTQNRWNHDYRINRKNVVKQEQLHAKQTARTHRCTGLQDGFTGRYSEALELIKRESLPRSIYAYAQGMNLNVHVEILMIPLQWTKLKIYSRQGSQCWNPFVPKNARLRTPIAVIGAVLQVCHVHTTLQ